MGEGGKIPKRQEARQAWPQVCAFAHRENYRKKGQTMNAIAIESKFRGPVSVQIRYESHGLIVHNGLAYTRHKETGTLQSIDKPYRYSITHKNTGVRLMSGATIAECKRAIPSLVAICDNNWSEWTEQDLADLKRDDKTMRSLFQIKRGLETEGWFKK